MILLIVGFYKLSSLLSDIILMNQRKCFVENFFSYRNISLGEKNVLDGGTKIFCYNPHHYEDGSRKYGLPKNSHCKVLIRKIRRKTL